VVEEGESEKSAAAFRVSHHFIGQCVSASFPKNAQKNVNCKWSTIKIWIQVS
jgi:hypothetical protein